MDKKLIQKLNEALNQLNATQTTGRVATEIIDASRHIRQAIRLEFFNEMHGRDGITHCSFPDENSFKMVVKHTAEAWDTVTAIAAAYGLRAERWMENNEPRTSIY